MKTIRFIYTDICRSIYHNRYRYFIATILLLALSLNFTVKANNIYNFKMDYGKVGWLDSVIYLLQGIEPIEPDMLEKTPIPYVWISIQFLCGFVNLDYMHHDKSGIGRDIVVRSNNRLLWWSSKFLVSIFSVLFIYGLLYMLTASIALFYGGFSGEIHTEIIRILSSLTRVVLAERYDLNYIFIIPMLCSLTISAVQLVLSMYIGPVVSLFLVLAVEIISVFNDSKFLLGNVSMVLRYNDFSYGIMYCVIFSVAAYFSGLHKFLRSDII